jgi:hypothetical protein
LAAVIKGLGILSLKQHDIVQKLSDAAQDSKSAKVFL